MELDPPPRRMCGKCRRPLLSHVGYRKNGTEEVTYFHGKDNGCIEPLPVPVMPEASMVATCDFCDFIGEGSSFWTFPCSSFVMAIIIDSTGHETLHSSSSDWAACSECVVDVQNGDFENVVERKKRNTPASNDPRYDETLYEIWKKFTLHRLGDPRPASVN